MTMPACPKCGSNNFEVQGIAPKNSENVLTFVNCSKCGTVVGVIDQTGAGYVLSKALGQIADKLGVVVNAK